MLQCRQLFQIIRLYIGAVDNPLLFPTCSVSHHNPDTREALADKTASVTFRNAEEVALPPPLPLVCFLAPYPPNPLPRWGRGRLRLFFMQGASPLASPGAGRDAALKVGGMRRPAGACPGRHGQVNSGSPNPAEAAKPILQHPTFQPPCRSAGEGRNRARTPDPINHNLFGKVLGGLGDSFKSPPALPRASMRKSKRRRRFFFADCRQAGENVL